MKPKVILRHCATYDPERIKEIILEGMGILGVHPVRRTLVKPNLVMLHTLFLRVVTPALNLWMDCLMRSKAGVKAQWAGP